MKNSLVEGEYSKKRTSSRDEQLYFAKGYTSNDLNDTAKFSSSKAFWSSSYDEPIIEKSRPSNLHKLARKSII